MACQKLSFVSHDVETNYKGILHLPWLHHARCHGSFCYGSCSCSGFPFCRAEAGLVVTPLFGYFWNCFPFCWPSLSTFLPPLPSSDLSSHNPRFLPPSCFFVSDIFGDLSSFILITCPAHLIRLLTICQLYKLQYQLLLAGLSFSFSPLSLHQLLSLSSCYRILVVYVAAVRREVTSPSHMCQLAQHGSPGMTFPFSFLEIFLSNITISTFLHEFAPVCILRQTSTSTLSFSDVSTQIHTIIYLHNVFPFQTEV